MEIIGLDGRPISTVGTASNKGKITGSQASAVIASEIDIAFERWNTGALQVKAQDASRANLYKIELVKNQYGPQTAEATGWFGYSELRIMVKYNNTWHKVYTKGMNFKKENEMNNTNGYVPDLMFDCLGFLIAGGLLYNLALLTEREGDEQTQTTDMQREPDRTGEPGPGGEQTAS